MVATHTVDIASVAGSEYPVFVGPGALQKLPELVSRKEYSKVFVVTDETVAPLWLEACVKQLIESESITVGSGELFKNIAELEKIWGALLEAAADRNSLVINLGGGVIGDMGGFAAATYMRGIDFIQVPTTLLSQVDASVGGKLAVDFAGGKNCIGVFCQPRAVIADTETLSSLPERELCSGYAEVVKHGLIASADYFETCSSQKVSEFSVDELAKIVSGSVAIKARVVAADEKEGGIRKILNFGHTVGHAVESLSLEGMGAEALLHGEAVSIGMVAEAALSVVAGTLQTEELTTIQTALLTQGLPVKIEGSWSLDAVVDRMRMDKKNHSGQIRWTTLNGIGEALFDQVIDEELMRNSLSTSIGLSA